MLKGNVPIAIAGGLGLAFIGYCVYFDHKRRSHPDFKKNLIEKRKRQQRERAERESSKYPDLTDEAAMQHFFMTEISLGEQLMSVDPERAIEHLANAVAVTSHKENLLNVLRTTLPDPIYRALINKLPEVSKKIYDNYKMRTGSAAPNSEPEPTRTTAKIIDITDENLAVDDCLD